MLEKILITRLSMKCETEDPLQNNINNYKCINFHENTIFEISNLPKIQYFQGTS